MLPHLVISKVVGTPASSVSSTNSFTWSALTSLMVYEDRDSIMKNVTVRLILHEAEGVRCHQLATNRRPAIVYSIKIRLDDNYHVL